MIHLDEYLALRERPVGRAAMTQRWRTLLFMHFAAEPAKIQALLPDGLTVDTFPDASGCEMAWVGLVPFRMEGVTPKGMPEIPHIHAFPETNVRTYVHRNGREPAVWFFSLEAANYLACRVARRFFHLPYHEARMTVDETDRSVRYHSNRLSDGASVSVAAQIGGPIALPEPGSFEFFLVERYMLYSQSISGLFSGRVYHTPYQVSSVTVTEQKETLISAAGITPRPFTHTLFSSGVDVEVFALKRCQD